jgi:arginase family enzyme
VVNIDAHLDIRPLVPVTQDKAPKDSIPALSAPFNESNGQSNGQEVYYAAHSGSPFRQLLAYPGFPATSFVEFACQGMQCAAEHVEFFENLHREAVRTEQVKAAEAGLPAHHPLYWLSAMRGNAEGRSVPQQFDDVLGYLATASKNVFVSFDIDSVAGSDAPGVSCPATVGLSSQEALDMCLMAGKNPDVKLFDLSELCPAVEDYRTPMLAAYMFYHFLCGVAQRNANKSSSQ